jgi:formate dehydrogenase iron-sulfur subunit
MSAPTPLESFIGYKADTRKQCGNYSIDLPELKKGEQYRFHFDMTKCVGCHCCEVACNEQNNNPADIKWRRVGEMEGGIFPQTSQLFNSMSCNHCIDPACMIGCPTNSYIKFDNGIVFHDDNVCIGCQYCTWNCPYGVPIFHEERNIVTKCHMCHERLAQDQTPACVQACPAGAIEIEVFNPTTWLESEIDEQGNAPHIVDARITNATTRYTMPANSETIDFLPMDEHHLKPAHPEWPLVFMTLLTQMSLGGFFALMMGDLLHNFGFNLPEPTFWISIMVILPALIGLPLSALHLGRPFLALMAVKNIKTSWLSREAALLGLFVVGMLTTAGLYFFNSNSLFRLLTELITMVLGVSGIYAQAMIYKIEARPSWNRSINIYTFFGVGYTGILLVALMTLFIGYAHVTMAILALSLMMGVFQLLNFFKNRSSLASLKEQDKYYYQMCRTKRLYEERFANVSKARELTLYLGAIFLPLLVVVLLASNAINFATITLILTFIISVISEILGRYLFYVTVVPLQLPGNFFAGAQR